MTDVQHAESYSDGLIGAAREQRALAADIMRAVRVIKQMLAANADKTPSSKGGAVGTDMDLAAIRELVGKEHILPANYGKFIVSSANHLVHLESAALSNLVRAELHQTISAAEKPELVATIIESFWRNPQVGDESAIYWKYRRALNTLLQEVYLTILNDRPSLPAKLRSLTGWVSRHLLGVVRLQAAISMLLKHSSGQESNSSIVALSSLSIDIGMLIREMIASHIAALLGSLSINGISFNQDAIEIFSINKVRSTPFDGGWDRGKRAAVERIGSLSPGMRVSVRGILSTTQFDGGEGDYFFGELKDFTRPSVAKIAVPVDLLAQGLVEGCHVRVCGVIREAGSSHGVQRYIEIEKLNIRESHAENWKVAFQNLSSPYFSIWPSSYHVAFELLPSRELAIEAPSASKGLSTCETEKADWVKAAHDLQIRELELALVALAVALSGVFAWADAAALAVASIEYYEALEAYNNAHAALELCLGIPVWTGGGLTFPGHLEDGSMESFTDSFDSFGDGYSFESFGSGYSFGSTGGSGESWG
jgi:hypothetical protein